MSSVTLITIIIAFLSVLVCYAFVVQSIRQKKQLRGRLIAGLKLRARNFQYMLSGFPPGFLPRELTLLVQRSLKLVLDQLAQLEPRNPRHTGDLQDLAAKIAVTEKQPDNPGTQLAAESIRQISEIKSYLEELFKFVQHLEMKKQLNEAQAIAHRSMVKQLLLQLSIDAYILHARAAQEKEKPRLAFHYYDLAQKLMQREGRGGQFDAKLARIGVLKQALEQSIAELGAKPEPGGEAEASAVSQEWDEFDRVEQSWKKKQIYD